MNRDLTDKKFFSKEITQRFLFAMDRIIGSRGAGKVTAKSFAATVGSLPSNLNRLRENNGENTVRVETIGRLCHHYKISPYWLITGQGEMYNNDELISAYKTVEARLRDVEEAVKQIEISLKAIQKNSK